MPLETGIPDDSRKADATRAFALGLLAVALIGETAYIAFWRFNPNFDIVTLSRLAVAVTAISLTTLWLLAARKVAAAGYFFIVSMTFFSAAVTHTFGGHTGPMAVAFLFPIVASGMVISIKATLSVASLATFLYLADIGLNQAGLLPDPATPENTAPVIPYLAATAYVLSFYLLAFMSYYAARQLSRALEDTRRYALGLQTANEDLRATEEELRASNEELRAIEEELRSANDELRLSSEELKYTHEKLVRSEKLAAIGQLAGGVGHELRNPLGAINNAAYYIKGKIAGSQLAQKEPRVMQFLNLMEEEINSANKIISDLLGFSRVGRPTVSPARIERVIESAISRVAIPPNIELAREVNGDLPIIEIDTDQIQQVLLNLLTNAVQAMPEGGRLTVGARKSGAFLEVAVSDTGTGMTAQVKDKAFEPLFTTKAKGIGLGLAVSKSITERHDGHISVVSETGKGATFTVKLPLATEVTHGQD